MNHEYEPVYHDLSPHEMKNITENIQFSKEFELDELCHIVLKGTTTRVGYLGDNSFELVDPRRRELREHHRKLKRIADLGLHISN